ncbi:MAG TPA: alpha/beta fold hydrolase [Propionibacteriaceae bacterium]|nr:alpha/beta fold hydrolase [Propionibacteriaceae bacterium]
MTKAPHPFGGSAESFPGLDPAWSRNVSASDAEGVPRTWHLLDSGAEPTQGTLLCVHGNPTWSYLWRRFLTAAPAGWRVIAVDQLGMGWSERLERPRTLSQRIDDLSALTEVLGVHGPVITAAHDWGGPVSLGWALAHRSQLAGVVLANTAVSHPVDVAPPALIRIARTPALRTAVCVTSPTFVRATAELSRPPLPAGVRRALAAPYGSAERRWSVGDFVADIPLEPDHPTRPRLEAIADGLSDLRDVPALLLWGPRDPVFTQRYLHDLIDRLPHADVHRYAEASHLVTEDVPETAEHTWRWIEDTLGAPAGQDGGETASGEPRQPPSHGTTRRPWAALDARTGDPAVAVVAMVGGRPRQVSFDALQRRVRQLAAGLAAIGVRAGDRVALLVPPGVDLTTAVYACWRIGAVIVVADAGLGLAPMGRALRGAGPDLVLGVAKGLTAAAVLQIPGRRVLVGSAPSPVRAALGSEYTLERLIELGRDRELPREPDIEADSAVLFTSGATGPAKGVVYRLHQLQAQLELVGLACGIGSDDRLVAAFAPFALYGPALGIGAAVPDMDVTAPGTLTAQALADAVAAIDATVVFASPAALRNVCATQQSLTTVQRAALGGVRRVMSAGAPVPIALLRDTRRLMPAAELHTPYGMTEALPVADVSLTELEAAGHGNGVCVGRPLPGVGISVAPLDGLGRPADEVTMEPGVTGELCVSGAHIKDRYDRLWVTEQESARTAGWHRTGDVGHVDEQGRWWVEGRLVHVVTTAAGPVTPVGIEQRMEQLDTVTAAAVVGVGPAGTQQVVAVVVPTSPTAPRGVPQLRSRSRDVLADPALTGAVRSAAGTPLAAVLTVTSLPVDIRHASKVDRSRLARWAEEVLAGRRVRKP